MKDDLERFSFNTGVSNFMICVNELTEQKCNQRSILEPLIIMLSPYAPHICEELWEKIGNKPGTVSSSVFPAFNEKYLSEENHDYPISFNGKMRMKIQLPTGLTINEIEEAVLSNNDVKKWMDGNAPKKLIVVPQKIVNIVF